MSKKTKPAGYIVTFFDPTEGFRSLYGADSECDGALSYTETAPLIFPTRAAASKAVRISTRFAQLEEEQGKPANSDFTTDRKNLRIIPLTPPASGEQS